MIAIPLRAALTTAIGGLLLGALLLPTTGRAAPMEIAEDAAHSHIQFTAHTKIFDATGRFRDFDVKGKFDPDKFTDSKFTVTIRTKSVDTDNGTRDDHLRSEDFFHVDKHPVASFAVDKVVKGKKPGWFIIKGTLTIKGKKTKHSIPMKVMTGMLDKKGTKKVTTLKGKFKLNRMKVGVDWPGSLLLPDIEEMVDMDVNLVFKH